MKLFHYGYREKNMFDSPDLDTAYYEMLEEITRKEVLNTLEEPQKNRDNTSRS